MDFLEPGDPYVQKIQSTMELHSGYQDAQRVVNIQTKRQGILFVFITDRKKDSQMRHDYHHEVLGLGLTNFGDALKGGSGTRSEAPGQIDGQMP